MALIPCSECGRAVSDKAPACIGCGAPIATGRRSSSGSSFFAPEPLPSKGPALTRVQLLWRALLAALTFLVGVLLAIGVDRHGGNRLLATVAALLVVSGLCWLIVASLQNLMARRKH